MNTALLASLSAFVLLFQYVLTHPVKYDQRQEGELNVRTDVEDVVLVVVPPPDLVAAGMGLIAATAADFLRKNYGGIGPERWPLRTPPKLGFVPLEKSPYKIDLEKSGVKVKKIPQVGDPNRYNFQESKNPSKVTTEVKPTTSTEVPVKSTTETSTVSTVSAVTETQSTTESKTVKKVLKPEKLTAVEEEKPLEEKKEEKVNPDSVKKAEAKSENTKEAPKGNLKVVGVEMDPESISRLEDCGPEAYRDINGKCVIETPN